jgi:amino acid transporter
MWTILLLLFSKKIRFEMDVGYYYAVSAVVAMASVLLVFKWVNLFEHEPRWFLPKRFSKIHPKYKTPSVSATIVTGFV